jgi:hypothetical protein
MGIFHFKQSEIPISIPIVGDDFEKPCEYAWGDRIN